jgi:DNA primase
MSDRPDLEQRKAEVERRLSLSAVVERNGVKLSGAAGSSRRRGKCPFHGSNSPSFALFDAEKGSGRAFCFGCQWQGDVFAFQRDIRGIAFMDALVELEQLAGCAGGAGHGSARGAGPIQRERNPISRPEPETIASIDMGRWIWKRAAADRAVVKRYFLGRGVPEVALTDARLAPFRFLGECPCMPWRHGENPRKGLLAPAIVAMVRVPQLLGDPPALDLVPTGLHVTYLNPGGDGTMVRRKPWAKAGDEDPWLPKRRMLGAVKGGAIVLGEYWPGSTLYVGEGNETVLSAIALARAPDDVVGVATLSLDNLQGHARKRKGGVWPLFAIEPDPERPGFTIPGHLGRVIGLVDSDMSPLRGARDRDGGAYQGEAVVECKGGPIVRRPITGAERAQICGELVVKSWRAAGVADATALRAPAGKDFNDVAQEARAA